MPNITYDDSVEEALCFGWIDSIMHASFSFDLSFPFKTARTRTTIAVNDTAANTTVSLGGPSVKEAVAGPRAKLRTFERVHHNFFITNSANA